MKKAIKSTHGLKAVMAVLAEEEATNQGLIAAMSSAKSDSAPTDEGNAGNTSQGNQAKEISSLEKALPATALKLNSILRNKNS